MLFAGVALLVSQALTLSSPNRDLAVKFESDSTWSLVDKGETLFRGNKLGISLKGEGDLLVGAKLLGTRKQDHHETIPVLFGRASKAQNSYREVRLAFESRSKRHFDVSFRCFDDAVALRYVVGARMPDERIVITDESTSFAPVGDPTSYVQVLENYRTSHEHKIDVSPLSQVQPNALLDMPLTLQFAHATASITEAALRHYAGMGLRNKNGALVSGLTPREDGTKVVIRGRIRTPWRVVLVAAKPGQLLESNTIYCLNPPNAIGDTSWIHPGKITFSWWNGNVVKNGKPSPPIFSLEAQKLYIDFAAANGIRYHSTICDNEDTPWYRQKNKGVVPGPTTDVTHVRDGLDLAGIKRYADSKGVKLWTWVHSGALRGHVEKAFAAFEKIGWSGMMVDFLDHDDQDTVEFAEEVLKSAARHHISIHFHGIWKPTGLSRTYPNLMNHEGALNEEYMKWSNDVTPDHTLKQLFTRMVAGPMDYHSGGFRAVRREDFQPHFVAPNVEGTRAFMLASYICFDNPNPMVCDYPGAYQGQPGLDFLKIVPTYWDETKVLLGEPGKLIVTARRKGKEWWIGGMSSGPAHAVTIPTRFLGTGPFHSTAWSDDVSKSDPNSLAITTSDYYRVDSVTINLATDGGFALHVVRR